jgi:5'-nucleotidase
MVSRRMQGSNGLMSKPRRILLTNDDGYFSDGIGALYSALQKVAEVYLVAPDREQSAASHSLTLNRPLRMHRLDRYCYTTDGTPTDCVMLAIHMLFKRRKPDMIISGINHGPNMGDDVTYSGTVAAAIEGSILKIPSLAVSMAQYEPGMPMVAAARFVARLVSVYDRLELSPSVFLNVNLPGSHGRPYRCYEFTRLGVRHYRDIVIHRTDPRHKAYYWIGGRPKWKASVGSDFDAVRRGLVSITPLQLCFEDTEGLARLSKLGLKI